LLRLRLPWPPSVNNYYRRTTRGVFISKNGRVFRANVRIACLEQGGCKHLTGQLQMEINLYPPTRRVQDIDNLLKALWDAMEHAGVYENDKQIRRLVLEDAGELGGYVEVSIASFHVEPDV